VTYARARWGFALCAALLAFAIQTSLLAPLSVGGIRPDLVLVVVVAFALHYGPLEGLLLGLAVGFAVDVYGGRLIGMGGLSKLVSGAVAGVMGEKVFREHVLVPAAIAGAASFTGNLVYLALVRAFGIGWPILHGVQHVIFPSAAYDALACLILYPLLARVYRMSDRLDEGRRMRSVDGG